MINLRNLFYITINSIESNIRLLAFSMISFIVSFFLLTHMTISTENAYQATLKNIKEFNPNLIYVEGGVETKHLLHLAQFVQYEYSPCLSSYGVTKLYDSNNLDVMIQYKISAVRNDYFYIGAVDYRSNYPIDRLSLINGSIWGDIDDQIGSNVVVIDKLTSMFMFGTYNSIGMQVKLHKDIKYTVVGVVSNTNEQNYSLASISSLMKDKKMVSPYESIKLQFYVPYNNYLKTFNYDYNRLYYDYLYIMSKNQEEKEYITNYFNFHDIDSYITKDTLQEEALRDLNRNSSELFIVFIILVSVSLINLVNVMIYSIKSRTQEIGIRRALGASRMMIYIQVTCELVLFLMMSCGIGISLAIVFNIILNYIFHNEIFINIGSILIIYLSSILIGVLFSILPSYKASKIKISAALRIS